MPVHDLDRLQEVTPRRERPVPSRVQGKPGTLRGSVPIGTFLLRARGGVSDTCLREFAGIRGHPDARLRREGIWQARRACRRAAPPKPER